MERLYLSFGWTAKEIAGAVPCNMRTVLRELRRRGIEPRRRPPSARVALTLDAARSWLAAAIDRPAASAYPSFLQAPIPGEGAPIYPRRRCRRCEHITEWSNTCARCGHDLTKGVDIVDPEVAAIYSEELSRGITPEQHRALGHQPGRRRRRPARAGYTARPDLRAGR
jgi:hypothetical protein